MSEMVKKHKIALFLDKSTSSTPSWVRIKKSTAFDLTLNPETAEYDYIADELPTTELKKYKPSLSQALTMYKGEEDYELVFDRFFKLATGSDAKVKILIVFFQEEGTEGEYKAWQNEAVMSINDLNSVDSTITFDLNFGGNIEQGTATVEEGVISFVAD